MGTSIENCFEGPGYREWEAIGRLSSEWPESFETFQSLRTSFFDRMFIEALLWGVGTEAGASDRPPEQRRVAPIIDASCEEGC